MHVNIWEIKRFKFKRMSRFGRLNILSFNACQYLRDLTFKVLIHVKIWKINVFSVNACQDLGDLTFLA